MKIKNTILLLVMLLITVTGAYAATFTVPTASQVLRGPSNTTVNVTVNPTTIRNISNCTVTGTSALTSDSFTLVLKAYNVSGNYSQANATFNSSWRIDASDWSLTGTCYNLTGSGAGTNDSITSVSVIIDNTAPSLTSATPADNYGGRDTSVTFSAIVTGAIYGNLTYDGNIYAMTNSSGTFSYTLPFSNSDIGISKWSVTLSDGYNSTTSSERTYNYIVGGTVAIDPAAFNNIVASTNPPKSNNNTWLIVFGVLAALYFFGGKKGKRK